MKNIKIIFCIVIVIICMQLTYARFITKQPNATVEGNIGQAIINLEEQGVEYTGYNDAHNLPCLFDSSDTITYNFNVNNYNSNDDISDVDLIYSIYVVFYDEDGNVKTDIDGKLVSLESGEYATKEVLMQETTLNINGVEKIFPEGTIKFSPSNVLFAQAKESDAYELSIKANIDSLPMYQIIANMKMYCKAEQSI